MSLPQPDPRYAHLQILTMKQVCDLISYTPQHTYRLIRAGKFPRPVRMGLNRIGFRLADVEKWFAERPLSPLPSEDDDQASMA